MRRFKILLIAICVGCSSMAFADEYSKIAKDITKDFQSVGRTDSGQDSRPSQNTAGRQAGTGVPRMTLIAVIPLSYVDGRRSVSGAVISERLTSAMVGTGKLSVVERSQMEKLLNEQKLGLTGAISDDSAQKFGNLAGAGAILTGTMSDLKGDRIEVNVRLIATETGKILSSTRQVLEKDWVDMTSGISHQQEEFSENLQYDQLTKNESFMENEEGLKLLRQDKFDEAIVHFSKALESNPSISPRQTTGGVKTFSKVGTGELSSKSNLSLSVIYNNRGVSYFKKKDYKKAIQDFSVTIEHDPSNAVAFNNRGAACLNIIEYDRAVENFSKAIEIASDYADAWANRGDVYFRKGLFDKALEDYAKAIELEPDHFQARTNRGSVYFRVGKLDKAVQDYSKVIELNPERIEPCINRGFVYFDLKKYEDAVKDFSAVIKKDSKAKEACAGLGLTYLKQGKMDLAKSAYQKAIALDSRYKDNVTALTMEGYFYTPNQISAFREMELALKKGSKTSE